jgi:hypothetical protein
MIGFGIPTSIRHSYINHRASYPYAVHHAVYVHISLLLMQATLPVRYSLIIYMPFQIITIYISPSFHHCDRRPAPPI